MVDTQNTEKITTDFTTPVIKPAPSQSPEKNEVNDEYTTVKVKDGDTLLKIANEHHVGIQQLRFYNGLNKFTFAIHTGDTIKIPNKPVHVPVGE